jgi:hypothetical protein
MRRQDRAVVPSVGDQQDHAADSEVTLLDANTPFERLKIVQAGFGLDHLVDGWAKDHDVRAPKVTGQRHGDFSAPPEGWRDTRSKAFDERQVRSVADRRTRWEQTDSKVKTKTGSDHGDSVHRDPLQFASLEPTDRGVRQARDGTDSALTQARSQSSGAQFDASSLPLDTSHPDATVADAVMRSHAAIMGRRRYLSINRRSPPTWRQTRSNGRTDSRYVAVPATFGGAARSKRVQRPASWSVGTLVAPTRIGGRGRDFGRAAGHFS